MIIWNLYFGPALLFVPVYLCWRELHGLDGMRGVLLQGVAANGSCKMKYPDRFAYIYLFESEDYEPGEFLLLSAYQTGLAHDLILCSHGGSADLRERMPLTRFIGGEV